MSVGRLKPNYFDFIQANYVYLKENVEARDLVDYLFQLRVITLDDKFKISATKSKEQRNEILLTFILHAGPGRAFMYFLQSLEEKYKHVLQKLKSSEDLSDYCSISRKRLFTDSSKKDRPSWPISKKKKYSTTRTEAQDKEIAVLKEENQKLKRFLADRKATLTSLWEINKAIKNSLAEREALLTLLQEKKNALKKLEEASSKQHISAETSDIKSTSSIEKGSTYLKELDIFEKRDLQMNNLPVLDIDCSVGTDHKLYIPFLKFSMFDLPQAYQHEEMESLVKSLADLTVMVEVRINNSNNVEGTKPTFWQGTGKVDDVFIPKIRKRNCRCVYCRNSDNPSQEWGEVRIVTNVKLLNGNQDASKYKCTLFFDDVKTSSCELKYLYGDRNLKYGTNNEVCKFMCVTCDMELLNKLDKMVDEFVESWKKSFDTFSKTVKSEEERLVVLVSHPHGCSKQISIGKWVKDATEEEDEAQIKGRLKYSAATCPGSSGAFLLNPKFNVVDDIFK